MVRRKCAYNCEISSESDVTFFKFPLYHHRRLKKWLANMTLKDWTPSRFSMLCSNHFEEQYIDRTGKSVKLKADAVPTIFSASDETQSSKVPKNPRNKKSKQAGAKASQTSPAQLLTTTPAAVQHSAPNKQPSQAEEEPAGVKNPKKPDKWRIIVDQGLMKIESFPHFFHGDYCVPQDIQWAPDDNVSTDCKDPVNVIEVKEPWQWLGLDVRGPLPQTSNQHKFLLTVTDYYSKWVEAVPMQSCVPSLVAKHIVDIVNHFGFPLRILSRLPLDIVHKINKELKEQLKVSVALVVSHQQTGSADLTTQHLIDRMVNELVEDHAADWDVYLPATVFSLCFKEHSQTKQRPFSVLCCKGLEPVQSPRDPNHNYSKIQESAFVVRYS